MPWRTIQIVSAAAGILLTLALAFFSPDLVAIHFNAAGAPDGWASKWMNALFFSGLFLFLNLVYGGLPALIRKIPVSLINVPNREYWFAPERKESAYKIVTVFLAELAVFTNIFLAGIGILLFYANKTGQAAPPVAFFALMGAMFICIVLWIIHLIRAFRLPKPAGK